MARNDHRLLNDQWPADKKWDRRKLSTFFETIAHLFNNMNIIGGTIRKNNSGMWIQVDQAISYPASFDVLSFDHASGTITIAAGYWSVGLTAINVAEVEVTVNGGAVDTPHFVYMEHTIGSGTATINSDSTATYPASTQSVARKVLWAVYKVADPDRVRVSLDHRHDPLTAWVKI
jgi:hypothetical protein